MQVFKQNGRFYLGYMDFFTKEPVTVEINRWNYWKIKLTGIISYP